MDVLEGKVAFITGAGSGIGRGIAERLARDGADVCVSDIDMEGAEETAKPVGQAEACSTSRSGTGRTSSTST